MTKISSIPIQAKRMGIFISNLWNAITLIENKNETTDFFKALLTPTEIRMMAKRVQIAKMLIKGYKYEDIRNFIRVTDSTISSVNNQLQFGNGGYIKTIERLIKIEIKQQEKLEGKKSLLDPGQYSGRKSSEWVAGKLVQKGQNYFKRKSIEKDIKESN
ncbi:MAG: YerC/YecD family TrpR-related protein [Candidatus Daviesbacteria bacterium]|nr:YerC/YecD family TrpR-related protein [Candidatus Daviesbacteria bacterium]